MVLDEPIDFDLPCMRCEYNLRGLKADSRCPECRLLIVHSIPEIKDHTQRRAIYQPIANRIGCPVDGMLFVLDAISFARHDLDAAGNRLHPTNEIKHLNAMDICKAIIQLAIAYFNDPAEAKELLTEWGITRSEDVGTVVYGLVSIGHMKQSDTDTQSDFVGIFTTSTLFQKT